MYRYRVIHYVIDDEHRLIIIFKHCSMKLNDNNILFY